MIQWRDKHREKGLQLTTLEAISQICRQNGVPLIINDDVDVALVVGADGVHVGQKDLPITAVRRIVPADWIVGASTNNAAEARRAVADGATYVSVGNLFGTTSKDDTRLATLEVLHAVKAAVSVPVCAIGGINASNIRSVIDAGADMASVISAVVAADDPREAARCLAEAF
jgi:thiamine-phosphate pyrophosphorylase